MFVWITLISCLLLVSSIYFVHMKRKQRMMKQRNHAQIEARFMQRNRSAKGGAY
ncbi:hypothetical protein QN089_07590 [Kurthia sp. YJT4]|uniref:hypothetical protein n=1 Tax=Kurthia TaxID=1649 RepID=UPI0025516BF7|nr:MULTISPECIES: hypothetical protein [Kurthia]MEB6112219.1 hypothetical protein [Kurthia gibsonii]WIL40106.1 hypothetical protein QN089_07590 [Kurthia sp. YJT4]